MTLKILITGGTGMLGRELIKLYPHSLHPTKDILNITRKSDVGSYFQNNKPDVIIHCAALTNARQCEENKKLAYSINVHGTENLINACTALNTPYFLYISTAAVFDGETGNYLESDVPNPSNFYSLTKLLGECVVKYSSVNWTILRVNFISRHIWPYSTAFTDRYGTYLFVDELAQAIKIVIHRKLKGVIHIYGNKKLSMYQIAQSINPDVVPTNMNEYSGPPLPRDMSLASKKIHPFPFRQLNNMES